MKQMRVTRFKRGKTHATKTRLALASIGRENGANFDNQYDTQYENHTTDSSIGER